MAACKPVESAFARLKDKVVVLSGTSTGIGRTTATLAYQNGAKIVFGDINQDASTKLVQAHPEMTSMHCDVMKYDDIYALFKTARDKHGRVDHAVSCAGIFEQGKWFDPDLTIDSVKEAGNSKVIDVNVMGSLNFARVAAVFLREGKKTGEDKSLVLLSSVSAFRESPGLTLYQTSKHAIHGLLRASRKPLWERDGIRVNAVCPGVTESEMTRDILPAFQQAGLWWQTSESVAKMILGLQTDESLVGKAVYVEGGEGWEFEDSFYREQPRWLGEEPTRRMRMNAEAVNRGALQPK